MLRYAEYFRSLETVESVPSPDWETVRLRESDDLDLFGGGRLMLSGLSNFSSSGKVESHCAMDGIDSEGFVDGRVLLPERGSLMEPCDLAFPFPVEELAWGDLVGS